MSCTRGRTGAISDGSGFTERCPWEKRSDPTVHQSLRSEYPDRDPCGAPHRERPGLQDGFLREGCSVHPVRRRRSRHGGFGLRRILLPVRDPLVDVRDSGYGPVDAECAGDRLGFRIDARRRAAHGRVRQRPFRAIPVVTSKYRLSDYSGQHPPSLEDRLDSPSPALARDRATSPQVIPRRTYPNWGRAEPDS
jgi:hypothetical protein